MVGALILPMVLASKPFAISFPHKLLHLFCVFFVVVAVCHGVFRILGYEDGFAAVALSLVERTEHGVGYVGVGIAVDEEHRFGATLHLLYLLRLVKRPSVSLLAKPGSCIHQRERRQPELLFQLSCKLIPYARIATVFNKTLHIIRSFSPATAIVVAAPIEMP